MKKKIIIVCGLFIMVGFLLGASVASIKNHIQSSPNITYDEVKVINMKVITK